MRRNEISVWVSAAVMAAAIGTGCMYISIHSVHQAPGQSPTDGGQEPPVNVGTPSPNSGSLPILLTAFTGGNPGSTDCFPASSGWNGYYVTGFFYGPFSSEPANAAFSNANDKPHLTIDTKATENGTNLDTGILIARDAMPNQKVCNDNAEQPFPGNTNLSSATFSNLVAARRYRLTIFFKTNTAVGLTNIVMNWTYH